MKRENVLKLNEILKMAEKGKFGVGSFSPRYVKMIRPVLQAGQEMNSPLIVQISQKELIRYEITPEDFASEFYKVLEEENITIPVVLHLDHTKELAVIKQAIEAGFTSVMIDASEENFEDNISITKEVVDYSHPKGISVEAELGKIGTTDFIETDFDEELYTIPEEAKIFVEKTNVDALAVSVGTAHGVYEVKQPKVDFERLSAIRKLTPVHLVLHGGSGVPAEMIRQAIELPNGGISKVNIATDLELAFLQAIGRSERMMNEECNNLSADILKIGREAVKNVVKEKMEHFLGSSKQV